MTPSDPVPEFGLSRRMRDHEARLLADSLRTSRLTLLYAGSGPARRELLQNGVVPLVARRETDLSPRSMLDSRVVQPFVDRRGAAGSGSRPIERAVFFDGWGEDPLGALFAAMRAAFPSTVSTADGHSSLADLLQTLSDRLGARVLVVLDAGEQLWAAGTDPAAIARFFDAFGEAVDRRQLPANFLFAVDERFEGRMESLRRAVPRFDDSTVRLLGFEAAAASALSQCETVASRTVLETAVAVRSATEPPTLSDAVPSAPPAATRPRRKRPPKIPLAPPIPIKTDGVYAFIESTLTQTADASEPWHESGEPKASAVSPSRRDSVAAGLSRPSGAVDPRRGRVARRAASDIALERAPVAPLVEPPSPIDEWLDTALAWCRRVLRLH